MGPALDPPKGHFLNTAEEIRRFIEEELLEDEPLSEVDPLVSQRLESLAIEELISHLEELFDIEFEDEELVAENFMSLDVLASLVERKRKKERGSIARADTA